MGRAVRREERMRGKERKEKERRELREKKRGMQR